jgi:hypothetical protein
MQGLVRDGLDLARSTEIREAWSVVDIDRWWPAWWRTMPTWASR